MQFVFAAVNSIATSSTDNAGKGDLSPISRDYIIDDQTPLSHSVEDLDVEQSHPLESCTIALQHTPRFAVSGERACPALTSSYPLPLLFLFRFLLA
jgi:hypothetical protein